VSNETLVPSTAPTFSPTAPPTALATEAPTLAKSSLKCYFFDTTTAASTALQGFPETKYMNEQCGE
jgi:hypothetical protein